MDISKSSINSEISPQFISPFFLAIKKGDAGRSWAGSLIQGGSTTFNAFFWDV